MTKSVASMFVVVVALVVTSACSGGEGSVLSPTSPTVVVTPTTTPIPVAPVVPVVPPATSLVEVPWAELPPLSTEAKKFITDYNLMMFGGRGTVTRWKDADFPLPIYATPDHSRQDLEKALELWSTITNRKLKFVIVENFSEAKVTLDMVWPPTSETFFDNACGSSRTGAISSVITFASASFALLVKPECLATDRYLHYAHEIGHIMGLSGHTASRVDIMSPSAVPGFSPLLVEVINWLYLVPPGTKPM